MDEAKHHFKIKRKNTCIEKNERSIKRVFLFVVVVFFNSYFAPEGVMCLYMRLKPGHKTPEQPE